MAVRTNMKNIAPKTFTFEGIYRGVVEDNKDPDKLGRCRIRVWGLHDEGKVETQEEGIPTEKLPWGEPCLGLLEGSVSGHGLFSVPLQGSHVFCFFEGGNWEALRYFATAPGLPVDPPDTSLGFNDPDGLYPREDRIGESDFHRLSRGEKTGTVIEHRNSNVDVGVENADGSTWDEPESSYAAEYPNNIVLSTHRGLTIEIDSTEGNERLHIFHPSNTYIEIDSSGNLIFRNEADRFEITKGDRNKHIFGSDNETVDIDKTSYVKKDKTERIDNDEEVTIGNNSTRDISVNETKTVGADYEETIGNNSTSNISGSLNETVGSDWTINVSGNVNITSGGNVSVNAGGNVNVTASGPATVQGSVGILKGTSNTLTVS